MPHLVYQAEEPKSSVEVMRDLGELAKTIRLSKTSLVVVPVSKTADLKGVPLSVLADVHRKMGGENKLPRKREDAAKIVFREMGADRTRTGQRRGVGARFRELILAGYERDRVVNQVRSEFPKSRATKKDFYIYRSKLRKEGLIE